MCFDCDRSGVCFQRRATAVAFDVATADCVCDGVVCVVGCNDRGIASSVAGVASSRVRLISDEMTANEFKSNPETISFYSLRILNRAVVHFQ